jgi:inosine/xanthosine triphosphate pyrophosphatase family protein
MAELDEGEKNLVSHRGRAVRALRARWGELEVLGRGGQ